MENKRESVTLENRGQQMFGILHRPVGISNPPLVMIHHGFASSKHGSNRCYVHLGDALAKEGIAAFRFDFRGSGDSEGSLAELSFEDLVSDAHQAYDFVNALKGIDRARIGVFGASLGGSIAVLSNAQALKVKAMALWAPVASGELWYRDFLRQNPQLINIEPSKVLANYRGVVLNQVFRQQFGQMFAAQALEKLKSLPVLHMHGEKDSTLSLAHQEAFRKVVSNAESRFITYPGSEHSLGFSPAFPEVIQETLKWFKNYL